MPRLFYAVHPSNLRQRLQNRWGLAEYSRKRRHIRRILVIVLPLIALSALVPGFGRVIEFIFWAIALVFFAWAAHVGLVMAMSALSGRSETPEQAENRRMGEEIVAGWAIPRSSRPRAPRG